LVFLGMRAKLSFLLESTLQCLMAAFAGCLGRLKLSKEQVNTEADSNLICPLILRVAVRKMGRAQQAQQAQRAQDWQQMEAHREAQKLQIWLPGRASLALV
jgi:hypothetical protein